MSAAQVLAGREGAGRCASETQAHATGLDVQLAALGWEQRQADRFLKG